MQKITKSLLVLSALLLFSASIFAQMSDEQVISEALKQQQSGKNQSEILQNLIRKGVTAAQFQRIQARINQQQSATPATSVSNYNPATVMAREVDENVEFPHKREFTQQDTIAPENKIFGQDFFSHENLTFSPNVNMPTPANYVLGPGDEVIIDVWGDSELNLRYTIAPDGYITVPGLGRIQLSGMKVEQATSRIRAAFSSIYSDLDSGQPRTFIGISVGNTRTIKVNVMGEVTQPGTYTLTSFASVFHALYLAGGPNAIGSLRDIHVFRGGKIAATIDMYEYLMKGNNMGDITLRDGDVVKVEPYGILTQIRGEVKRPKKYEMRSDETLSDLIRFAGGFSGDAFRQNLLVERKGEIEKESHTVAKNQYNSFGLQDGDAITVGNILDKYSNTVTISGAVHRPGKFAIGEQIKTVKDLITVAGGTTGDAFLHRALLDREKDDFTRIMQSIDLAALMDNQIQDITLRKNDSLFVPSVLALNEARTIYVGGEVQEPGTFSFADNMSVEDAIIRAGGFTESASLARIDIYRRVKDPMSTKQSTTTGAAFTFAIKDGLMNVADKSFVLQPYDQVVIRSSPGYEPQQNVTVTGEVVFGGQYAKLKRGERLSSFIKRAGGLTDEAYTKGARLMRRLSEAEISRTREALLAKARFDTDTTLINSMDLSLQPIGIDLEKALKEPDSDADIILLEGDVISVPFYVSTVKISGGVNYPNTVTYQRGMSVGDCIRQAGGYSRLARKNHPFVVYLNGRVASGLWAKVEPGCEIVVPEQPEREPMSLQNILAATSSLATIALIISRMF